MYTLDDAPVDGSRQARDAMAAHEPALDTSVAFRTAWQALAPNLQQLWHILAEVDGNQVEAARRLGLHRNTVRSWLRQIAHLLTRHGFRQ